MGTNGHNRHEQHPQPNRPNKKQVPKGPEQTTAGQRGIEQRRGAASKEQGQQRPNGRAIQAAQPCAPRQAPRSGWRWSNKKQNKTKQNKTKQTNNSNLRKNPPTQGFSPHRANRSLRPKTSQIVRTLTLSDAVRCCQMPAVSCCQAFDSG